MEFARQDVEFFLKVEERRREFNRFILDRLQAWSNESDSKVQNGRGQVRDLEPIKNVHEKNWGYWMVDPQSLKNTKFVRCLHRLDDDRGPTTTTATVEMPWVWVFGELEANRDYQTYLELKARFEPYNGEGYPQGTG